MSASHADPRVDATLDTLQRLRMQLQQDMAMISRGNFAALGDRNRQKLAAAIFMRDELTNLLEYLCAKVEAQDLPNLDPLKETLTELITLAEQHQRCVQGAIVATQMRIQTVIEARRTAYGAHETYGPKADLRRGQFHRSAFNIRNTDA